MDKKRIVIIGGVACGPKAASRIRRLDPKAEITIIEKGEILSYAGCGLPFYISGDVHDYKELMSTPAGILRDTIYFKKVKDIIVHNRTLAKGIDRGKKTVHAVRIDTGEEFSVAYDALVLATGASPIRPPIEGIDLNGVNMLSTIEDARIIKEKGMKLAGKDAVIIGGGLIGMELTESFASLGMNVTVIEKMHSVLAALLDPEMAFHVQNELVANDVRLTLNNSVQRITGDDQGNVRSVVTEKGEYPADMVLVAVGNTPTVVLAKEAGLELGATGAIKVDANCRTSDPDIYAGGDCVESVGLIDGKPLYAPMGSTANKHGRVIADNICGRNSSLPGVLGTAICGIFDINVARTGLTEREARARGYEIVTVLNPAPDKAHFHPRATIIIVKLIADAKTRRILGAQIVGSGDVANRIDVAATAISRGDTVDDIAALDLAYAPPFSPAMDNIIVASGIAQNKMDGLARAYTPTEVKSKIDRNEDFVLLDVRTPKEFEKERIDDTRVMLIPLGTLRERLGELPRGKEIVSFCKFSLRGYEAQRILEGAGFSNVRFMDGGVICWPYAKT